MAFQLSAWWRREPDNYAKTVGKESPWKVLGYAEKAMPNLKTPEERAGCIALVKDAADLYFQERRKKDVPQKYVERVAKLEERATRLDVGFAAEQRLTQYGEPRKALERFKQEAEMRREKAKGLSKARQVFGMSQGQTKAPPVPAESKQAVQTLGIGL